MVLRVAKADDVLVTMSCPCGTVLVHEASADAWRCDREHPATRSQRFVVVATVLDLDTYEPEHLERLA